MVHVTPPDSLRELSDEHLVGAACAGDREAFEALISRHSRRLVAVVRAMVDHPQDAEDIVQDALLRAWRAIPTFRGEAAFGTWLHRIAVNAVHDFRRRRLALALESIDQAAERERETWVLAFDPGPEQRLQRDLERRVVLAAIAALREPERSVVVLRELEAASTAQTAQALGISEELVRWRLYQARKQLRVKIARCLEINLQRNLLTPLPHARPGRAAYAVEAPAQAGA